MIKINNVSMYFPLSRRYKDYLLKPLSKQNKFIGIDNFSLQIEEGDRVAFLGVNGAGKTTLLKLIGGLLYPSAGEIKVNGYNTVVDNLKARKTVGFVLNEERSFYWRLTAVQNLRFFGVLDNLSDIHLNRKIHELIMLVGLQDSQHKLVATYSSGMKQRLAIARGLLCDPKILILDEPTRTLDPEAVQDVKKLISQKIHEDEQRTLLIATHRFDEAEELCNKICIMKGGKLLAYNTLKEVKSNYQSIAEYYQLVMTGKEVAFV